MLRCNKTLSNRCLKAKAFHFKTKTDCEGIFTPISKRRSLKIIKISLKHFISLHKYIEFEKKRKRQCSKTKQGTFAKNWEASEFF
jgi:hypothetical protein